MWYKSSRVAGYCESMGQCLWSCCWTEVSIFGCSTLLYLKYAQIRSKSRQTSVLYQSPCYSRDQRVSILLRRYVFEQAHLLAVAILQRSRWPPAPPHRPRTTGHFSRHFLPALIVILGKSMSRPFAGGFCNEVVVGVLNKGTNSSVFVNSSIS
jgi:hypothetical protein